MDEAITALLTTYGPLALGWVAAYLLLRHILSQSQEQTKAMVELADTIRSLEKWVREALRS